MIEQNMRQRNLSSFKNADALLQPFAKRYFKLWWRKFEATPVPKQITIITSNKNVLE